MLRNVQVELTIDRYHKTRRPCCRRETARCRCNFPRWRLAAILDLMTMKTIRTMKWIGSPVAEIWPFEYSKMAAGRHLEFVRTGNGDIRSADPKNPTLKEA